MREGGLKVGSTEYWNDCAVWYGEGYMAGTDSSCGPKIDSGSAVNEGAIVVAIVLRYGTIVVGTVSLVSDRQGI
jgi:hypothetical protein